MKFMFLSFQVIVIVSQSLYLYFPRDINEVLFPVGRMLQHMECLQVFKVLKKSSANQIARPAINFLYKLLCNGKLLITHLILTK